MILGVPAESYPDERRVAVVPSVVPKLTKLGFEVSVERGAGMRAGFSDEAYEEQGARIVPDRAAVASAADVFVQVHGPGAGGAHEIDQVRYGQVVLGLLNPLGSPEGARSLAEKGATAFALELLPRISRAQSMDALSSMATISGYKAVLLSAAALNKIFPLMMTAAGTITPARVFVIGAGVAGLQAAATAHRLGGVVHAYDVRPAVREQVESLGVKFVELELETSSAEGKGGYAQSMGEDFYTKQRELMTKVVCESNAVITTAAVPGKKAPVLITEAMVKGMHPGSVIVDLAAESGGNCELTRAGENIQVNDVTIIGAVNLPATIPFDASQMYARNVLAFLTNLVKDGAVKLNRQDQVIGESLLAHGGEVVHPIVREMLGMPAAPPAPDQRSTA